MPNIASNATGSSTSATAVGGEGPGEHDRLRALHGYGVLDSPREAEFDDIAAMAAKACGTPIALVNLIDRDRQWLMAEVGLGLREMPLDPSICTGALGEADLLEVRDLARDPRFADNPLVSGPPHARFYAGVPLTTPDGLSIGVLCVVDTVPGRLTEQGAFILRALARAVMDKLEGRKAIAERDRALARGRSMESPQPPHPRQRHRLRHHQHRVRRRGDELERRGPPHPRLVRGGDARAARRPHLHARGRRFGPPGDRDARGSRRGSRP